MAEDKLQKIQKTTTELSKGLSQKDLETLTTSGVIPSGTPPAQVKLFAKICEEKDLSPFSNQIYLVKRGTKQGDRYTAQTGIDGYRTIAQRTGVYAGNDDYKFDEGMTEYACLKNNREKPVTATATVYKIVGGQRVPFSATVNWKEYYPGEQLGFMWKKMPYTMLGKVAEGKALRKAFPEALAGIYTDEEMTVVSKNDNINTETIEEIPSMEEVETKPSAEILKTYTEEVGKIKQGVVLTHNAQDILDRAIAEGINEEDAEKLKNIIRDKHKEFSKKQKSNDEKSETTEKKSEEKAEDRTPPEQPETLL